MRTPSWQQLARTMVRTQLAARGITDARVLDAMRQIPRHLFLPQLSLADAYSDNAQPIEQGQTISQPYMVAMMTQLLDVQPGHRVLEIGTGSGYQTAVLLMLGAEVWTLERSSVLSQHAQATLDSLGLAGQMLHIVHGDGTLGWPAGGPYDRIVVTAGAPHLPAACSKQLATGGKIVIPIGPRQEQLLCVFHEKNGVLEKHEALRCRFVPLIGEDGWDASHAMGR